MVSRHACAACVRACAAHDHAGSQIAGEADWQMNAAALRTVETPAEAAFAESAKAIVRRLFGNCLRARRRRPILRGVTQSIDKESSHAVYDDVDDVVVVCVLSRRHLRLIVVREGGRRGAITWNYLELMSPPPPLT
jgi:hypothetical protein